MKKVRNLFIIYMVLALGGYLILNMMHEKESTPVAVEQSKKEEPAKKPEKTTTTAQGKSTEKQSNTNKAAEPSEVIGTSVSGGFPDSFSYIGQYLEKVDQNLGEITYVMGNIKLVCQRVNERCSKATFYFEQDPSTPEDAFKEISEHLPKDAVLDSEFESDKGDPVYNMTSLLVKENSKGIFPIMPEGDFHIDFKRGPDNKVFAAIVEPRHE